MGKESRRTRNVTKNSFVLLERIWGENGVVCARRGDTGRLVHMTIREAASRAHALNEGACPAHLRAHRDALIDKIMQACREAADQCAHPDKKTTALLNLTSGLTIDGKKPPVITGEEALYLDWSFRFPLIRPDELRAVIRDVGMPDAEKLKMLADVNNDRAGILIKEQQRLQAPA